MTRKSKKQHGPKTLFADNKCWKQLQGWLDSNKGSLENMDSFLDDVQAMVLQIFKEREQQNIVEYFEKAVDLLREDYLPELSQSQTIQLELWKGHSFEKIGAWSDALSVFQSVVSLCRSDEFIDSKIEALRWIGHIKLMQNQFKEALSVYTESLNLAQSCMDEAAEANAFSGLGYYYFEQGNLEEAKSYWQKALAIAEPLNEMKLMAQVSNNLGAVANVQGRWEEALASYSESILIFEKTGDSRGLAETYHNMGMTYTDTKRWLEAEEHYEKSYQLAKESGDVRLQATVKLNRIELFLEIDDIKMAQAMCGQAMRIYKNLDDHLGEADVCKFMGIIFTQQEKWDDAKTYFGNSIRLTQKFSSPLCEAEAHFEYGKMYLKKGNKSAAQKRFERALTLFSNVKAENEIKLVKQYLVKRSS